MLGLRIPEGCEAQDLELQVEAPTDGETGKVNGMGSSRRRYDIDAPAMIGRFAVPVHHACISAGENASGADVREALHRHRRETSIEY
jgi:hypothetical protein